MKNKRESGEVVVEASIIVTLVFIVISVMFYIGMVLYQQTAITVVANRTASSIAQVYSNTLRDTFTGYVDPDKAYQSVTYSNMKTDAYLDVLQQKGSAFTQYRLKRAQIIPTVKRVVDVDVVSKPGEVLKSQIVVKVRDIYDVPLMSFFGNNGEIEFSASGRADCVDYLEYLNGVEAIANPEESPIPSLPDSDTCIVTFVLDKYTGGFHAAVPVLRGKSIISSNRFSHSTMPKDPVLNGMKFSGWVTADGKNFTATKQINQNTTVYAAWKCKITFKPEGGKVSPTTKTVDYRKTTTFPTPTRDGFAFEGWFTEKNGGGQQYYSNVTEINGNVTLYAKWRCLHKYSNGTTKIKLVERVQYICREAKGQRISYELYKCADCSYSEKKTIENKHYINPVCLVNTHELLGVSAELDDFNSQCNVNHLSKAVNGITGSYNNGFGSGNIKVEYHITCDYCGMHQPPVWWDNITGHHKYAEIYWTANNSKRNVTACRTPNWKRN